MIHIQKQKEDDDTDNTTRQGDFEIAYTIEPSLVYLLKNEHKIKRCRY